MRAVTSRLEINVYRSDIVDPVEVVDFAKKHGCAAIIVDPIMFDAFNITKIKRNYTGALGIMVDFPKGTLSGISKLSQLPENIVNVDCMDIMFRANLQKSDYKKELQFIANTIKNFVSSTAEFRPVVDFTRGEEVNFLDAMKDVSAPRIRIGNSATGNAVDYLKQIKTVRNYTPRPITLSGNINLSIIRSTMRDIGPTGRYGVNYVQACKIVKDAQNEPKVSEDDLVIEPEARPATFDELQHIVATKTLDILHNIPGATGLRVVSVDKGDGYIEITADVKRDLEKITIDIGAETLEAKVKFI